MRLFFRRMSVALITLLSYVHAQSQPIQSAATPAITKQESVWGQGVLEVEFLTKLRLFLESTPLDYKEFGRLFGVQFEVSPKETSHKDGSWSAYTIGSMTLPFGKPFRDGGYGPSYSFTPNRNSSALWIELLKLPSGGLTSNSTYPCIKSEALSAVFEGSQWVKTVTYAERKIHLTTVQYPTGESYRFKQATTDHIWLSASIGDECIPYLSLSFDSTRKYPSNN